MRAGQTPGWLLEPRDLMTTATDTFDFGDAAEQRALVTGELLCEEGDTDTDVFQIVSGSLDVVRATAEGPMVVATMEPGRLVGEVTNAMGGARTATLRAAEPTVVSVLSRSEFADWLDAHPDENHSRRGRSARSESDSIGGSSRPSEPSLRSTFLRREARPRRTLGSVSLDSPHCVLDCPAEARPSSPTSAKRS